MTTAQTNVRFMDNNLADALTATISFSSALAAFPGTNALDQQRSRVWKPAGNFEVTTSNNKIYINDGGNVTVTLTVGAYTYASLAAHIQTQLNASSSNWTTVYSLAARRFTIDRASGTKTLRLTQTTNAAWDMLGYTGAADQDAAQADQARNHTSEWVVFDLQVAQEIRAFMECGPINEALCASYGATLRIRANNVLDWASPPLSINLTRFDRGIFQFIDVTDATYRYWKFDIIDRQNPLGPEGLSFGYFFLGTYTTVTTSNVGTGFTKKINDPSVVSVTQSGAEFFKTYAKYRTLDGMEIQLLGATERLALEQMFENLGISSYFFFCLDPGSLVTADLDEATIFARFSDSIELPNVIRDVYNVRFGLREVV